jgi:hypothetical protein
MYGSGILKTFMIGLEKIPVLWYYIDTIYGLINLRRSFLMKIKNLLTFIFCIMMVLCIKTTDANAQAVYGFFYWYGDSGGYYDNNWNYRSWNATPATPEGVYDANCNRVGTVGVDGWTITSGPYWAENSEWYNYSQYRYEKKVTVSYYRPDSTTPTTPPTSTCTATASLSSPNFSSSTLKVGQSYSASVLSSTTGSAMFDVNYKVESYNGSSWSTVISGAKQNGGWDSTLTTPSFTVPSGSKSVKVTWTIVDNQYIDIATGTVSKTLSVTAVTPATPTFSPNSGEYSTTQYVRINSSDEVYYTTDGTTPTTSDEYYYGDIVVDKTTTILARAYRDGVWSATASATFTISAPTATASLSSPNFSSSTLKVGQSYSASVLSSTTGSAMFDVNYKVESYNGSSWSTVISGTKQNGGWDSTLTTPSFTVPSGSKSVKVTWTIVDNQYIDIATGTVSKTLSVTAVTPATPTFSPNPGEYSTTQYVRINSSDEVYYTTDGTTPTTSDEYYYGDIVVDKTTTILARAYRDGVWSATASATFTINSTIPAPTFRPNPGTYSTTQYVTIDSDYEVYYTIDGGTPTSGDTTGDLIQMNTTGTVTVLLNVRSVPSATGNTPIGTVGIGTIVRITGKTSNGWYQIDYNGQTGYVNASYVSIDGDTGTSATGSQYYTGPITVDRTMTIRARAYRNGVWSATAVATYTINANITAPTFSPNPDTYTSTRYITINSDYDVYYTTDGTTPTTNDEYYTGPIMVDHTMTIKARAYRNGVWSTTASATYTINSTLSKPSLYPTPGTYTKAIRVNLTGPSGAQIYYTLNDGEPSFDDELYTGSIYISNTTTIRARAYRDGIWSATTYGTYYINSAPAQPTFSPSGGTYSTTQYVKIYCSTLGATIRYTTDGTTPTENSTIYNYQVAVNRNMTLKARAYYNGAGSSTTTATYYISSVPAYEEDEDALLAEARRLFNAGQYDESIEICEILLDMNSDCQDSEILLANNYVKKGQIITAKEILKEFIEIYEFPRVINRFAEVCIVKGDYTEARNALLNIIPKYPNEIYLYKTLTYAYAKIKISYIKVFVYGKEVRFENYDNVQPMIVDGRTLVPIRAITEAMGARVDWDARLWRATIHLDGKVVELTDGSKIAKVNGISVTLDVPAQIYNDRMLVPLRFVCENFGKTVDWYEAESARVISVNNPDILSGNNTYNARAVN